MANASAIKMGGGYVQLFTDNSAMVRGLKSARKDFDSWAAGIAKAGAGLAAVGVGMGLPAKAGLDTFKSYSDAILTVKAATGASGREFDRLNSLAQELGKTSGVTATNVAMIMTELGRAGFSVTQIEKMTSAVINMARASGTDAAVSAGIMSTAIRQFRLDASQATRVADSLTLAANATFNSVESLGEALSYAGPVAADFGMSLEDTLAIVGALGNVGIQGSEAGTAIRRLLIITGAESKKLEKIFGTSFRDSAGNALPLVDVLDKINSSTKNLSQNDRAKKLNEAFGLLGITSASALGKSAVDVKELRKQLGNAAGTAAETAAIMDSGFGGAARRVSGAIEGLSLSVGSSLEPTLKELSTTIVTVVNGVSTWVKNNPDAVTQIAKTTAGALAAGPALLAVAGGFKAAAAGSAVLAAVLSSPTAMLPTVTSGLNALPSLAIKSAGGLTSVASGITSVFTASAAGIKSAVATSADGVAKITAKAIEVNSAADAAATQVFTASPVVTREDRIADAMEKKKQREKAAKEADGEKKRQLKERAANAKASADAAKQQVKADLEKIAATKAARRESAIAALAEKRKASELSARATAAKNQPTYFVRTPTQRDANKTADIIRQARAQAAAKAKAEKTASILATARQQGAFKKKPSQKTIDILAMARREAFDAKEQRAAKTRGILAMARSQGAYKQPAIDRIYAKASSAGRSSLKGIAAVAGIGGKATGKGISAIAYSLEAAIGPAAKLGATLLPLAGTLTLVAGAAGIGYYLATETEMGQQALASLSEYASATMDGLGIASKQFSEQASAAFGEFKGDVMAAGEQAVGAWQGVVDAVSAGDLSLAAEVGIAGLKSVWLTGTSLLRDTWDVAIAGVTSVWTEATHYMMGVGEDLSAWFQTMWLDVKGFAFSAFDAINNKWDSVSGSIADKIIDISVATGVMSGNAEEIKQARREDTARRINTRDAVGQAEAVNRDAAKAKIEANRQAGQKGIEEARRQRQRQIEEDRNAALLANDQAEKDAKKQLDDLRKRAAERAKVAAENKPDKEPPKPDAPGAGGKGGTSSATDKPTGGAGDKSELQVSGLAASLTRGGTVQSPEERKAKAVQKTTAAVREQADAYEFLEAAAKSAADVAARAAKAAGKTAEEQKKAADEAAAAMRGKPLPDKPGKQPPMTPAERKEQADFIKQWKRQYQSGKPDPAVASDGSPGVSFGQQSWSSQYGSNVPLPIPDLSGVTMPDISSPDRIGQPALEVKVDSSKQEELLNGVISELRSLRSIVTSTGGLA